MVEGHRARRSTRISGREPTWRSRGLPSLRPLRRVPRRPAPRAGTAWPMMALRHHARRHHPAVPGTARPVHHYSFLSSFADLRGRAGRHRASPSRRDVPLEIAGLVGCAVDHRSCARCGGAAGARPARAVAVIGCGGVGLSGGDGPGRGGRVADRGGRHRRAPSWEHGAGRWAPLDAVEWAGSPGSHRGACAGCDRRRRRRRARGHGPRLEGDAVRRSSRLSPPRHRGLHRHPPGGHRGALCRRCPSPAWSGG